MNRLLNTLKSGTAIILCLTIALEPTSRAWASGNGQNMPGLNDKDEERKVVARQQNASPEKEKEKGEGETVPVVAVALGEAKEAEIKVLQPLAPNLSYPESMYKFFQYYWTTEGESKDKALKYLDKATKLGYFKAQRKLAHLHWVGQGVEKSYGKALLWYEKSASQGDLKSHFYLGLAAEKGLGKDKNLEEAFREYDLAEQSGKKAKVQLRRGRIYEIGKGVTADKNAALEYYMGAYKLYVERRKGEVNQQRRARSAFYAGRILLEKEETESEAYSLIKEAASFNLPKACLLLGAMHQYGWGAEKDHEKATSFFYKVNTNPETKKSIKATSIYQLAWMHKRGIGVQKNIYQALAAFEKAADLGHREALFQVGEIHFRKKEYIEALRAFEGDTLAHHAEALYSTAKLYAELSREEKSLKEMTFKPGGGLVPVFSERPSNIARHSHMAQVYLGQLTKKAYRQASLVGHPLALYHLGQAYEAEGDKRATECYESAAKLGHAPSSRILARLYQEGRLVDKKDIARSRSYFIQSYQKKLPRDVLSELALYIIQGDKEAFEELKRVAKESDPYAQKHLARLLIEGVHVPQDIKEGIALYAASFRGGVFSSLTRIRDLARLGIKPALEWVQRAEYPRIPLISESMGAGDSQQEIAVALNELGFVYHWAREFRATKFFEEAERRGHEDAEMYYTLAKRYENLGSRAKTNEYHEKARAKGHAESCANLGWNYYEGRDVAKNEKKTLELFEEAEERGYLDAKMLNTIGVICQNGQDGVQQDLKKANEYYEKARAKSHPESSANLGWNYYDGKGVPKDKKKARELFEEAEKRGYKDGRMFNTLGRMYKSGEAFEKYGYTSCYDAEWYTKNWDEKVIEYYEKARAQGYTEAFVNLGWTYLYGKGETQNDKKARELFEEAENRGYEDGRMFNILGFMYRYGFYGVKTDYEKARVYFQKSLNLGYAESSHYLGFLYYLGHGVSKDIERARNLFEEAERRGHESRYMFEALGEIYGKGLGGVPKDSKKAKEYFKKAKG